MIPFNNISQKLPEDLELSGESLSLGVLYQTMKSFVGTLVIIALSLFQYGQSNASEQKVF